MKALAPKKTDVPEKKIIPVEFEPPVMDYSGNIVFKFN
jgi:hypothetical protein